MHITIGSYFTEINIDALSNYNKILGNIKVWLDGNCNSSVAILL